MIKRPAGVKTLCGALGVVKLCETFCMVKLSGALDVSTLCGALGVVELCEASHTLVVKLCGALGVVKLCG